MNIHKKMCVYKYHEWMGRREEEAQNGQEEQEHEE